MRSILSASALVLAAAFVSPASAQMCGSGQAQANGRPPDVRNGRDGSASDQSGSPMSGCGCCQNMAMMQTPMQGQDADGGQAPPP
jgi:hypothetical protein